MPTGPGIIIQLVAYINFFAVSRNNDSNKIGCGAVVECNIGADDKYSWFFVIRTIHINRIVQIIGTGQKKCKNRQVIDYSETHGFI
jgi:hypothetical protein